MEVSGRPRLLFLAQSFPFPPHSGVTKRTFNIIRQLQPEFDIVLISFFRRRHQPKSRDREEARQALGQFASQVFEPVRIGNEWSRLRLLWDHMRSLAKGKAFTWYEYASSEFTANLKRAVATIPPALIHIDSLDLYRHLRDLPAAPVACTHHNVESQLLRRRATRESNPLLSRYLGLQASLIENIERRLIRNFTLNVTVSELDAQALKKISPGARMVTVPNGVDTNHFLRRSGSKAIPGRIVFLGPTYMFANRDAVEWFLESAWARIKAKVPAASLDIIGSCAQQLKVRYQAFPGVEVRGYVDDVRPYLESAACSVVPIRVGGGTRLKILDAWAMEVPVVSTTVGCEGLATEEEHDILTRDSAEGFADAVVEVVSDPLLAARLGAGGRATAERVYDWNVVGRQLRSTYESILG